MKNNLVKSGRLLARSQLITAIFVTLVSVILVWVIFGNQAAVSALLAGFTVIIPQMIFAFKAFQYAGAQASEKVVASFFKGEKIKMLLSVLLIALVFKFFTVLPMVFFVTYSLVMVLPLLNTVFFKL